MNPKVNDAITTIPQISPSPFGKDLSLIERIKSAIRKPVIPTSLPQRPISNNQTLGLLKEDSRNLVQSNSSQTPLLLDQSLEREFNSSYLQLSLWINMSKEEGLDNIDPTHEFFSSLVEHFQIYLFYRSQLGKIPNDEIKKILLATLFEQEIPSDDIPQMKVPHNYLTLFFMHLFCASLRSQKLSTFNEPFLQHLKNCQNHLFLVKLASSYDDHNRLIFITRLKEHIYSQLLNLKNEEEYALPGGWINVDEIAIPGHFILYLIKRIDDKTFEKIRINTHAYIKNGINENPNIIEKEIVTKEKLETVIKVVIDLQFKDTFSGVVESLSIEEPIASLFEMGRCDLDTGVEPISCPVDFELQMGAPNCTFLALLVLYQYLLAKEGKEKADIEEKSQSFRNAFQNYLKSVGINRLVKAAHTAPSPPRQVISTTPSTIIYGKSGPAATRG